MAAPAKSGAFLDNLGKIYMLYTGGFFAFVIVLWYSFEGNLLTAYNPLACVMLMTMFVTVAARRPAPAPLARTRAAGPAEAPA